MSRYRFLSGLVSCFVFACGDVPIKTSSIPKNLPIEIEKKQPPKNTWQSIKQLEELPDDYFNNVKEAKANLIKMLPQTEAEFNNENFDSKRHKIYRRALKLYGAVACNLLEENEQRLSQEKVRSLLEKQKDIHQKQLEKQNDIHQKELEKQKNIHQKELKEKDVLIESLQKEIEL